MPVIKINRQDNTIRVQRTSKSIMLKRTGPRGLPGPGINIDTDPTLSANSDSRLASQKAMKTYVDTGLVLKANDNSVIHNTGAETIAGVKTFISAPVVPSSSFPESAITNLVTDLAGKYVKPGTGIPEADLTSALQTKIDGAEQTANRGVANGYASLDSSGKITSSELPALALTDTYVISSQVAMLALSAHLGDVAIRTDLSETFILTTSDPTVLANWQQILTPAAPVQSVAGRTGNVTLTEPDITNLVSDLASKAVDSTVLHLASTEIITGAKTFNIGTLFDKGNQVFNVKAYGAVGDGIHDDTAAIQAAINAATYGGTILLPDGIYLVSNTLSMIISGSILKGAGQVTGKEGNPATLGAVIKASSSFPSHKPILIAGTPSTTILYLGISVYGINFELGTSGGAYADGLYFFNNDQGVCEEVFVDYPYASGIWMGCVVNLGNGGVDSGHIVHCKVAGAFNNTVTFIDDASGSHTLGGTALEFGPYMYYGTMEGCSGIGNLGNTFGIGDPNNTSGNHNKLIGCEADGAGVDGFYIAGARSTLIGCSSFSPTGHNALHFFAADGTVATGCSFAGSNANNNQVGSAGAVVFNDSSRGVIFTNNQIFDNPHGYPTAAIWENGVNTGVGCIYSNNLLEPSGDNNVFGTNIVLSAGTTSRAYDNHGFNSAVILTASSNLTPVANTYIVNTSSATRQALPDATLIPDLRIMIKNIGTGLVSIGTAAPGGSHPGQTIDGVDYSYSFAGYNLLTNESVTVVSDGSNWNVVSSYSGQKLNLLPFGSFRVQMGVPLTVAASLASGGSLTIGTPYYYVITALDYAGGETVISSEVTITPTSGNQTASLIWGSPPSGAVSYNIYRSTASGAYYLTPVKLANVTTLSYTDTGSSTSTGNPPLVTTAYTAVLSNSLRLGSVGSVLYLGQTNQGGGNSPVIERGQTNTGSSTDLYIGENADTGGFYIRGSGYNAFAGPVSAGSGSSLTAATAAFDAAASTTSRASLRLRSGIAPTSPNNGDMWYDGTHLLARLSGTTYQLDQQASGIYLPLTGGTLSGALTVGGALTINSNNLYITNVNSHAYLGATNSGYFVIERGQVSTGSSTDLYIGESADTGHLYIRGSAGLTLSDGPLNINAQNVVTDTTTGTKIGTATNQKIAFYNSTPIVQPTGDIVTALQNLGLIASATLSESDVTNLVSDLALKAPLASPTFTGTVILPSSTVTNAMLAGSIASSKLVGTDITTVGTITAGTWNGTTIAVGNGGTGTVTAFTAGSVVFAGASGAYSQNNSKIFWDNTNNRLGLGTATPLYPLDVVGSGPSIYLRYPSFAASSALLTAGGYNFTVQYNTGSDTVPTWVDGLKVGLNSSGIGAGKVSIPTANASLFLGATNSGYFIIERGQTAGGSSTDLYIGETADTGHLYVRGTSGINISNGPLAITGHNPSSNSSVPSHTTVGNQTITGTLADGMIASLQMTPTYTAATAQTVTRHNYLDLNDVVLAGAGPAALTNSAVMRFNAAAGTHKAIDSATTKTTPGGVDAWVKININGTIYYIPAYASKTA